MISLERCLPNAKGKERLHIMLLLGILYKKRMITSVNMQDWHFECKAVYSGLIHRADIKVYEDIIAMWENKLTEKESSLAGYIICRAFRLHLKDQ